MNFTTRICSPQLTSCIFRLRNVYDYNVEHPRTFCVLLSVLSGYFNTWSSGLFQSSVFLLLLVGQFCCIFPQENNSDLKAILDFLLTLESPKCLLTLWVVLVPLMLEKWHVKLKIPEMFIRICYMKIVWECNENMSYLMYNVVKLG